MEVMRNGNILVSYKNDVKNIYEYRSGKEVKVYSIDGQKRILKEFKSNYLIVVTFERRN